MKWNNFRKGLRSSRIPFSIGAVLATVFIIYLVSSAPLLAFRAQDEMLLKAAHPRQRIDSKLSPEAENIYLVRAIHDLYNNNGWYFASGDSQEYLNQEEATALYEEQLNALKEAEAINEEALAMMTAPFPAAGDGWPEGEVAIDQDTNRLLKNPYQRTAGKDMPFFWMNQIRAYSDRQGVIGIDRICLPEDGSWEEQYPTDDSLGPPVYQSGMLLEPRTHKALIVQLNSSSVSLDFEERQKMAENYICYLGLDVIDDWEWKGELYCSEKAQLYSYVPQTDNYYYLDIFPITSETIMPSAIGELTELQVASDIDAQK